MRRISANVYAEIYYWGCNPGFLTTADGVFMVDTPQQPIDAVRWRERIAEHGTPRHLVNTEPHGDHIMGNAYFPGVEVIGHTSMLPRYEETIPRMQSAERVETMKQTDPDSVWLLNHPDFPPNPPTRLFEDELTLRLGDHTVRMIHMPGHTKPQTAVFFPEEGVVFPGDNVFHHVKTFIQEGDPWEWLTALDRLAALDASVIVPGHGEPCGNDYLATQREIIEAWIGVVQGFVDRGMTEDEAVRQPLPQVDPYPIGQRLYPISESLDVRIVTNLHRQMIARRSR